MQMPVDEAFLRANAEANEIFERMRETVEARVNRGEQQLNVLEVVREAGLEVDERHLSELQLPDTVLVNRILPWYDWFPFRPWWCWWWRYRYPYYKCCPWWWYRCHWYPW
jgi:hypothetical protein